MGGKKRAKRLSEFLHAATSLVLRLVPGGVLPGGTQIEPFLLATTAVSSTELSPDELASHGLRLPTDGEWEHAYRAGSTTLFPWGDSPPTSPLSPKNQFGFEDMGDWPELCQRGIARGGAGAVWPWQDVGEWTLLLSDHKTRASEHPELWIRAAAPIELARSGSQPRSAGSCRPSRGR